MTDRDMIALQSWWMGQLSAITEKVMADEEKRQKRARASSEKKMGEYRTFNDIQDAYGCGVISEKKRDKLYDLLENMNPEPDRLYEEKLALLSELYQTAKDVKNRFVDMLNRTEGGHR